MIELRELRAGYSGREVLHGISLEFRPGEVLVIAGPNGCGKSTLLRAAAGIGEISGGEVLVDGVSSSALSARQMAQKCAYMPQDRPAPSLSVRRMALHGRFPYLSYPRRYRPEDYRAVDGALERARASDIADSAIPELSGGPRQRAYLAMALAQETETLLMDEPTAFLDISHQLAVMDMAASLAREGKAVVMVLHDLCLALRRADRLAVISAGRLLAQGTPEEIYSSGVIDEAFQARLRRTDTPDGPQYYFA